MIENLEGQQMTANKPPLPPPTLSSISTYYGGLEARNVDDETGDVLIIRKESSEDDEKKQGTNAPKKIDVRAVSPPTQSRRLVEKRTEQVKKREEPNSRIIDRIICS